MAPFAPEPFRRHWFRDLVSQAGMIALLNSVLLGLAAALAVLAAGPPWLAVTVAALVVPGSVAAHLRVIRRRIARSADRVGTVLPTAVSLPPRGDTGAAGCRPGGDGDNRRMSGAGGPRIAYQPALDGVRALAVAAVLAFHGGVAALPGGFLGVDAFFVLSGFLITSLLLAEHRDTGRIDLTAFWGRRTRRLLPALLLVLLVVLLVSRRLLPGTELPALRWDALAALGLPRELADGAPLRGLLRRHRQPVAAAAHLVARHRGAVLPDLAAAAGGAAGADGAPGRRRGAGAPPSPPGLGGLSHGGPARRGRVGARRGGTLRARRGGPGLLRHRHPGGGPAGRRRAGRVAVQRGRHRPARRRGYGTRCSAGSPWPGPWGPAGSGPPPTAGTAGSTGAASPWRPWPWRPSSRTPR